MNDLSPAMKVIRLLAGPMIWIAHFSLLYVLHVPLCQAGAAGGYAWLTWAITALACGSLGVLIVRPSDRSEPEASIDRMARMLSVLSLVAVLLALVPASLLEPCIAP